MMEKNLLLIAIKAPTLNVISNYLEPILKKYVTITSKCSFEVTSEDCLKADLILYSGEIAMSACEGILGHEVNAVLCQRTIDYTKLDKVFSIPVSDDDVYLINETKDSAFQAIDELYAMGINQYHLVPLYASCDKKCDANITRAITLGPWSHQPHHLKQVVDIGYRIVSITTIVEIVNRLQLPVTLVNSVIEQYNTHITKLLRLSTQQLSDATRVQKMTQTLINSIESGACLLRYPDTIQTVNQKFLNYLMLDPNKTIGKSLNNILAAEGSTVDLKRILTHDCIIRNKIGVDLLFSAKEIQKNGYDRNFFVSVTDVLTTNNKKNIICNSNSEELLQTPYQFNTYISANPKVLTLLSRTRKIALRNSNVLIQGESGTGKEILAQGIHNYSSRQKKPFVAINFAGMQPNLIESELFGYEDGAFTGAKKGGKKGLWEVANRGTIFLDEVGDAPQSLQITLLRVLQEKEIRRVGGHTRIPVDVRVIAATNKDLHELVLQGKFREDLFFRLNVISIETIPLRERQDDIPFLFQHFSREYFNNPNLSISDLFTPELMSFLITYSWPGNVREVMNLCEYFSCIASLSESISMEDLPSYMRKSISIKENILSELERTVLEIISEQPKIGRGKILSSLQNLGITISDGALRGTIKSLVSSGFLKVNRTRGGCEVTPLTRSVL